MLYALFASYFSRSANRLDIILMLIKTSPQTQIMFCFLRSLKICNMVPFFRQLAKLYQILNFFCNAIHLHPFSTALNKPLKDSRLNIFSDFLSINIKFLYLFYLLLLIFICLLFLIFSCFLSFYLNMF